MTTTATALIRTLIVDDEVLARQNVEALLRSDPDISVVAQAGNGLQAVEAIREHRPDLVFLDVQMPGISGFEVLARLPATLMPQVVFVTAHDQFALQAFEVHAVDYVLKPFNRARFAAALGRAKAAVRSLDREELARRLSDIMVALQRLKASGATEEGIATARPREEDQRLFIRCDGEIHMLAPGDILWIESDGDYVRLHSTDKSRFVRMSLQKMMERLDPKHFVRIHRSTIVNLRHMKKAGPALYGEYSVELSNGMKLRVSRTFVHELKAHL
ncbi:Sensory transduction protein LytR [Lacunisphaera limnophila]|uniref:Sensory transduction protein LytR n=1 Tax=Lacunisphaera limnophila TaxID=1838286 RepID=A0A1D8ASA6_9BACT|nr:LytTR family DNA-binding domain-containing protein [Lacunisphaera limnophila]AOS43783.1 Sensory transduction protein LytR [Lacunisphaera limnophila]